MSPQHKHKHHITPNYREYLHSPAWKAKREEAFKLFGRRCRVCAATKQLEINHLHYRNIFHEDVANDLEVLCHPCHQAYHGIVSTPIRKAKLKKVKRRNKRISKLKRRILQEGNALTMDEYRRGLTYGKKGGHKFAYSPQSNSIISNFSDQA